MDWPEFEHSKAEVARLSAILNTKNREVVAKYDRNDTPPALAILQPIRDELRSARAVVASLLGKDLPPVKNPRGMFSRLRIGTNPMGRPNHQDVQRHIDKMVRIGRLTAQTANKLRIVLRNNQVMNPSSRGASQVAQHVARNLRRFAID
jgi:hypothetical protein